jgi:predicted HNH restriction endonuclease
MPVYSESDLVVPAVAIIARHPDGIDTTDLLHRLRVELKPSGDDLTILANRNDDKFSQKVRNLKSHETLEKKGLATFTEGKYHITPDGEKFALDGLEIARALDAQGFSEQQKQSALDRNFQAIIIEEGERVLLSRRAIRRSSVLKKAALKHFADQDGSIECVGCGFRAEKIYGANTLGLIEIHHTQPLYLAGKKLRRSIEAALNNVAPLCPTCHRVVHRDPSICLTVQALKNLIAEQKKLSTKTA